MVALILAAGYGTRLYPLAKQTPKALLPVRGKPILQYLIEKLSLLGPAVEEIVLVSNHRYAEIFQAWFSEANPSLPWRVLDDGSTSEENRLGSIGDLVFAIRSGSLGQKDLLLLGSDNLFRDGLSGFLSFARQRTPAVTLGAYELPDLSLASRYGVLSLDDQGKVLRLDEKPSHPSSPLVSMAVYFFPHTALTWVLQYVGSDRSADTLGAFIQWLIAHHPVFAHRFEGSWFDIGDPASYTKAEESFIP
ncbi:MAG: nucleotidyltransferase family protein [Candidatus Omnitrophica bacterium]|nr:nucleotidyltransferase family protein [Candidatus Omnitrophota bacterium]